MAGPSIVCTATGTFWCGDGRAPAGLRSTGAIAGVGIAADHLARMAHTEAAAVIAFRHLGEELAEHGAPARLRAAARRAMHDEVRHARAMGALARRLGTPPPSVVVEARQPRSLEALARENAVEGCVRETYGAAVATWRSRYAPEPRLRAVMRRIAGDETQHAALSFAIADWVDRRLDRTARARVNRARREAMDDLAQRATREPAAELVAVGMPPSVVAASFVEAMRRDLGI